MFGPIKKKIREYDEMEDDLFEQDMTRKKPLISQMADLAKKADRKLPRRRLG